MSRRALSSFGHIKAEKSVESWNTHRYRDELRALAEKSGAKRRFKCYVTLDNGNRFAGAEESQCPRDLEARKGQPTQMHVQSWSQKSPLVRLKKKLEAFQTAGRAELPERQLGIKKLTAEERRKIAAKAAASRWSNGVTLGATAMDHKTTDHDQTQDRNDDVVLMYPNNELRDQVCDVDDAYSMGELLRETFFDKGQ